MSRHIIVIRSTADRARAMRYVTQSPVGTRLELRTTKRSLPQNDRMWAMLTDIAAQKEHCGRKYTPEIWKCLMMHACGHSMEFIPALDNSTVMPLGHRSSDLSKDEMGTLIDFIGCWGTENGVTFHDGQEVTAEQAA